MRSLLRDALAGLAIALAVVVLMLFAAYDSTFLYRGF